MRRITLISKFLLFQSLLKEVFSCKVCLDSFLIFLISNLCPLYRKEKILNFYSAFQNISILQYHGFLKVFIGYNREYKRIKRLLLELAMRRCSSESEIDTCFPFGVRNNIVDNFKIVSIGKQWGSLENGKWKESMEQKCRRMREWIVVDDLIVRIH